MRWNKSRIVQKFIHSALAFSCLALIPFSGCSNASRGFSLGMKRDAAKSAERAERDLAEQKHRDALAAKRDAAKDSSDANLAGRSEFRRSPLADLLEKDTGKSNDPFSGSKDRTAADSLAKTATSPSRDAQVRAAGDSQERSVAKLADTDSASGETAWDQLMKDYLKDAEAAPSAPKPDAVNSRAAALADAKSPGSRELPAWARVAEPPVDRAVSPEPADATETLAKNETVAEPVASAEEEAGVVSLNHLTREDLRTARTEPGSRAPWANQSSESTKEKNSVATVAAEKPASQSSKKAENLAAKLQVQSLMSQSHSDIVRGNWLSAYRSALLAQQKAADQRVQFGSQEESPNQLVNEIATRLWGRPDARPDAKALAQAEARQRDSAVRVPMSAAAPISSPVVNAASGPQMNEGIIPASNDVFGNAGRSEWTPVKGEEWEAPVEQRRSSIKEPWTSSADDASRQDELPVIRSRNHWGQNESPEETGSVQTAAAVESTPAVQRAVVEQESSPSRWDQYVTQKIEEPAPLPVADHVEVETSNPWSERQMAPAPPIEFALATTGPVLPQVLADSAVTSTPAATSSESTGISPNQKSSFVWAIAGFLAALIATIIGLRTRHREGEYGA